MEAGTLRSCSRGFYRIGARNGGAGRVRTADLEVRNPLLYPSELQPRVPQNCTHGQPKQAKKGIATPK